MKNQITKKNFVFIAICIISFLLILSSKSYAEGEDSFKLKSDTIDVVLNGTSYISSSGGTGTETIIWESSDENIATVKNGIVTGKGIGKTTITATKGSEKATCTVNVIYKDIQIEANQGKNVEKINLFLGEHETEDLKARVFGIKYDEEIKNAEVTWSSSDENIVKIDSKTGKITAVKVGTAKITVTAAGVTSTCDVIVHDKMTYTDFSNAKYETTLTGVVETLKITGVKPSSENGVNYYYIVTSDKTKPVIKTRTNGAINFTEMEKNGNFNYLWVNSEENYMYTRDISKFAELNKDMYIWIIQEISLKDKGYYDNSGNYVYYSLKLLDEAKKIDRAELPKLNLIIQSFSIFDFEGLTDETNADKYTRINFNFPTDTENRKFTLKIGRVTDNAILNKIKNNNYEGITELLKYAKEHDAIYNETLTTTQMGYYSSKNALFDGRKLLKDKAYYFIYVKFDDENGKYYPIEGVTLGQAWFSGFSNNWDLWAYTSNDFKWDNLTSTPTQKEEVKEEVKEDKTQATTKLPQTGKISILFIVCGGLIVTILIRRKMKNIGF